MKGMWTALALILLAVTYRLLSTWWDGLPNVAPLMALAFCGGIYLPRGRAFLVPVAALLVSDIALNAHYGVAPVGWSMLVSASCYVLGGGLGLWAARNKNWTRVIGGCLLSSFVFYFATTVAAWLYDPAYAKTAGGLVQALTWGTPGYPPAFLFFRNSLASDLAFTVLLVFCLDRSMFRAGRSLRAGQEAPASLS